MKKNLKNRKRSGRNRLAPRNKKEFPKIAFNFWRISAYFRRSWFCSRRLSGFEPEQKSKVIFVPGSLEQGYSVVRFGCDKEKNRLSKITRMPSLNIGFTKFKIALKITGTVAQYVIILNNQSNVKNKT